MISTPPPPCCVEKSLSRVLFRPTPPITATLFKAPSIIFSLCGRPRFQTAAPRQILSVSSKKSVVVSFMKAPSPQNALTGMFLHSIARKEHPSLLSKLAPFKSRMFERPQFERRSYRRSFLRQF